MADNVNHPAHYETGKFECIDVMVETQGVEATQNFCVCNALKYVYRHKKKNGIEDLQKEDYGHTLCGDYGAEQVDNPVQCLVCNHQNLRRAV